MDNGGKQMNRGIYEDLISRRRWKLIEAVWLLHGVFIQTSKEYGAALEIFYREELDKNQDEESEVGRLSKDFIDRMLKVNAYKALIAIRVEDWKILNDEENKLKEEIRKFWYLLNYSSDIKQCEVSYVDDNGKWYALAPESLWNADYLIYFAKKQGFGVQWLINERYKKTNIRDNVIPFRKRVNQ